MRAVNLLPEDQRAHRPTGANSGVAYVLVGVLGALLIAALFYALTANQVSDREQRAAEAQTEAQRAEARTAALGPLAAFAQTKRTRIASVSGLAQARFDWERLVREVSLVLPRGTWLTELKASVDGTTLGGASTASVGAGAGAPAAAPTNTGPSANMTGCARRQPDVARLMVRLRRMHRVEDVTLNQSGQAGSGGAAGAAPATAGAGTCGRLYSFDLTIAFSTAPPTLPVKVPASLGGGS